MNEETSLPSEPPVRRLRLVRSINRVAGITSFAMWGSIVVRGALRGLNPPQTPDQLMTAALMLCGFWFFGRGLWLLANDTPNE